MKGISRRDFLRGSAAGIGMMGLGLMSAGCSTGQAAGGSAGGSSALPDKWDYEADVVIVGYGVAGAAAAREAIAEGVSCLVLEKCDEALCGGGSCASAGAVF